MLEEEKDFYMKYIGPIGIYNLEVGLFNKITRDVYSLLVAFPSTIASAILFPAFVSTGSKPINTNIISKIDSEIIRQYASNECTDNTKVSNLTLLQLFIDVSRGAKVYSHEAILIYINYRIKVSKLLGFNSGDDGGKVDVDFIEIDKKKFNSLEHAIDYKINFMDKFIPCKIFGDYVFLEHADKCYAVFWAKLLYDVSSKRDDCEFHEQVISYTTKSRCTILTSGLQSKNGMEEVNI